jgi:hypothetical protein
MSAALSLFKIKHTRKGQSQAGVGATLVHNEIITDILPPIVSELEKKITELQRKIDHILEEMQWHPNAISRGTAHPALQAAANAHSAIQANKGGGKTRRRKQI